MLIVTEAIYDMRESDNLHHTLITGYFITGFYCIVCLCQFLVSCGADGTAYIYDLNRKALLNFVHYPAGVTCLQSVPLEVSPMRLVIPFSG